MAKSDWNAKALANGFLQGLCDTKDSIISLDLLNDLDSLIASKIDNRLEEQKRERG